jgi:murein L,D-transpeptidase YcbB/YkuD
MHPSSSAAQSTSDVVSDRIRARIEAMHNDTGALNAGSTPIFARLTLPRFYVQRQFAPAWTGPNGLRPRADTLLAVLGDASAEGLQSSDYHMERLQTARAELRAASAPDPARLAEMDLLLTDAFMLYGSHLLRGHVDPETLNPNWSIERRAADFAAVLEEALDRGTIRSTLKGLAPPQSEYARLRASLATYRRVQRAGGWSTMPAGSTLRPGDVGPAVERLRQRLQASGDLAADTTADAEEAFGPVLEQAVKQFQTRHGLESDGIVGAATRDALNVPVEMRIQQLRLNMERWRWLPQNLGARYIVVNIAGFELRVMEQGQEVMQMRVVTGQPYRQTPVFSDEISYLVLNPYWHVPHSIAVKDKLPLIKQNPNYLAQQNMTLFRGWGADAKVVNPATVDWSTVTASNFPYRLRQDPGRQNALGRVKFMFPNKYNVYLHDTPSRSLFARAARSFSSGCIRLERPMDLTRYLLADQPEWTEARIQQVLSTNVERSVTLKQTMPVHLQYWTAWADPDGTIHFRSDIYARDAPLARAMHAPAPPASGL